MDAYVDIEILPDPEFHSAQLMSVLFSKLHRVLAERHSGDVGVSFPEGVAPCPHLGRIMRLHGSAATLAELMAAPWLRGLSDHVRVAPLRDVPVAVAYRRVRRVQVKSNPERLRRRQMKRHGLSEAQARERVPDDAARSTTLPFVTCESASTGHRFRLFIDQVPVEAASLGTFNAYGLSATATVPWF